MECDDETGNSVQIESEKAPAITTMIQLLPTMKKICPELDKYSDQVTDITVHENSYPSMHNHQISY